MLVHSIDTTVKYAPHPASDSAVDSSLLFSLPQRLRGKPLGGRIVSVRRGMMKTREASASSHTQRYDKQGKAIPK